MDIAKPIWDVRAEMTAHIPNWLDLPITILECELRQAFSMAYYLPLPLPLFQLSQSLPRRSLQDLLARYISKKSLIKTRFLHVLNLERN